MCHFFFFSFQPHVSVEVRKYFLERPHNSVPLTYTHQALSQVNPALSLGKAHPRYFSRLQGIAGLKVHVSVSLSFPLTMGFTKSPDWPPTCINLSPQAPKCWHYRCGSPCLAKIFCLFICVYVCILYMQVSTAWCKCGN